MEDFLDAEEYAEIELEEMLYQESKKGEKNGCK